MKLLHLFATLFCAAAMVGCLYETPIQPRGEANVQIQMEKVGALGKAGGGAAIDMKTLVLTLRSPGEDTRRDTLTLAGNAQQTVVKSYEKLTTKKTWALEAVAKDANGITIYRDSVKFTVQPEATTHVTLALKSLYSMLKANFYPMRDSVNRCQLWVNGSLVADSSFAKQSLPSDTLTLIRDYLAAHDTGTFATILMRVYGNWYGTAGALLYEGTTTIRIYTGQSASYNLSLNWVGPLAPIGQGKINVTLGTIGSVSVGGYLDNRYWQYVGTEEVSPGEAHYLATALDGSDRPYVVFQDVATDFKLTARRWNGSAWETVGTPGFSSGYASHASLAMGAADTPYVAFRDGANLNKLTVMRWNGATWEILGTPGFSSGGVDYLSLAMNPAGQPYVAFPDASNGNKITVMRWNGAEWIPVGTPGFSPGSITDVSLALSNDDVPYVAFRDASTDEKAVVMRWNGVLWETLGTSGFSPGTAVGISMALSSDDVPYVTFRDASSGNEVSLMRWNGSAWISVGTPGIGSSKLALSPDGEHYLAIQAPGTQMVSVKKWVSGTWQSVGSPAFLPTKMPYFSIALSSTGTPYVGAIESVNDILRVRVMRYAEQCCTGYAGGGLTKSAARR